jgi:hypothetical protein
VGAGSPIIAPLPGCVGPPTGTRTEREPCQ